MQLLITGVNTERPIYSIKAVRAATGLGLREAKTVVDQVRGGGTATITVPVPTDETFAMLADHGVTFVALDTQHVVLHALRAMPSHLTVADLLAVAEALGL